MGRARGIFNLIFLWAVLCSPASASPHEECPTIDLRSVHPLKMRDQGDLSWCYAHAAADYLQFYHRTEEQISAADIAIRYNERFLPRLIQFFVGGEVPETGFIRTALRSTEAEGFCPESSFPSDFWKKVYPGSVPPRVEMKRLGDSIKDLFTLHHWVETGVFQKAEELPFYFEFKTVGREEFFNLLKTSRRSEVLGALRISACQSTRKSFEGTLGHISMGYKAGSRFHRIHQALSQGMPVATDFFYGLLDHPDEYSHALSELHTALVMGQRFSPKRDECEYLIKDSFGSNCAIYTPEWDCESGNLWVSESAFREALISTVEIESP